VSEINLSEVLSICHHPKAGAVVLFSGEVRNHNLSRPVKYLFYEAYVSMAEKMIREITEDAANKFNLHKAVCIHRIGKLEVGESAVVVVTASSHRKEAYEANKYIIDRVKHEAPIWKEEHFEDGTISWGANCSCGKH
jgi:molybdopterin synthase catalytic subunit